MFAVRPEGAGRRVTDRAALVEKLREALAALDHALTVADEAGVDLGQEVEDARDELSVAIGHLEPEEA